MFSIDYKSRVAIFEQIIDEIERYVALGVLKPKEQIPSIRELAMMLGINPNTVKKAYDILENRGVIISKSTKGSFISENIADVTNNKINKSIKIIQKEIKELEKLGLKKEEIFEKMK